MMNRPECQQLDDYSAGVLSGGAVAAFEAHLDVCVECWHAVDQHRQMTRLLRLGVDELETVPTLLVQRTERVLRTHDRRRRARLVGGLAAAAVVLTGVGLALLTQPSAIKDDAIVDVDDTGTIVEAPVPDETSAKSLVRVSLLNPNEAILVPIETTAENVSIVRIYPAVKVAAGGAGPAHETNIPE